MTSTAHSTSPHTSGFFTWIWTHNTEVFYFYEAICKTNSACPEWMAESISNIWSKVGLLTKQKAKAFIN